ncbi:MAG: SIMPL domain-containing protein [Thalassobaculum sp.]|uniref:SIMPL domain-containing protein n=1 Tax=Thalassobaculum sp. TaxID=2022740 RepID=UPI0032EF9B9A
MPDQLRHITTLVAAILIAVGIAAAGKFAGDGFRMGRAADRYVTVKGLAERTVTADLAVWPIRVTATGSDLGAVQAKVDQSVDALTVFLVGEGLPKDTLERGRVEVNDLMATPYRQEGADKARYIIAQTVTVRSPEVEKIRAASARSGELVKLGVVFGDSGGPTYAFTGLNAIKPEMIAEATRAARAGAEQFAADSGSSVGAIRQANQGVFTIGPRAGVGAALADAEIDKLVRVVSTIEFFLVE